MALAFDPSHETGVSSAASSVVRAVVSAADGDVERGPRFTRDLDGPNTISASQARAARRREARRDQQAVASWLRELSRK